MSKAQSQPDRTVSDGSVELELPLRWENVRSAIDGASMAPSVLAADAGVAPRLVNGVREGKLKQLDPQSESKHQVVLGLGGSLTRLILYLLKNKMLELSEEDKVEWDVGGRDEQGREDADHGRKRVLKRFLVAFGFSEGNKLLESAISTAIRQSRVRKPRELDDPATTAIRERAGSESAEEEGICRPALLQWSPYVASWDTEESTPGFANRMMRGLFSSMMPWAKLEINESSFVRSIREAVDDLVTTPPQRDALFALYVDPSRMGEGLEFLEVPGVVGHLGIVVSRGYLDGFFPTCLSGSVELQRASRAWLTFLSIRNPASGLKKLPTHVLVIDREIGHSFISRVDRSSGSSADRWRIQTTVEWDSRDLAETLRGARRDNPDAMFVAEWNLCAQVVREYNMDKGETDPDRVELAPYHPRLTPRYRTGIAFRADARMLASRLRTALNEDLLGQSLYQTASWYVDLLTDLEKLEADVGQLGADQPPTLAFQHEPSSIRLIRAMTQIAEATSRNGERLHALRRILVRDKHVAFALFGDAEAVPESLAGQIQVPAWYRDCKQERAHGGADFENWLKQLRSVIVPDDENQAAQI